MHTAGKGVFNAEKQIGYFELNGVRLSIWYRETGKGIELIIFQDRTSPTALEKINNLENSVDLSINVPNRPTIFLC